MSLWLKVVLLVASILCLKLFVVLAAPGPPRPRGWIRTDSPSAHRQVTTDTNVPEMEMQTYLNKYQTTWTCKGEGRARACLFQNIWWERNTRRFWVHGGDEPPPSLQTTNKWGTPTSFGWLRSSDFKVQRESLRVRHRVGDHLFVDQTWTWNIGHALWDGLFSSWTAMLTILDGKPPAKFRVVLHAYDQMNEKFNESLFRQALQKFGGNGLITYLDDRSLKVHDPSIDAGWECFARIVIGAGAKGLRWYQKDMRMAGTKYMRAFRDRMLIMHGIKPSSSEQQNIISVFENKRYGEQGVMREIQHDNFHFEASLVKQGCTVHAFDCTTRDVDNRMARAGVIFEPICIGESSDLPGQIYQDHLSSVTAASNADTHNAFVSSSQDPVFMPLNDVLDSHGHSHLDLLKMDIEGHEWRIFEHEIIGSGSQRLDSLPYEISFELHTEMANKACVSEALVKGKNKREVNELFIKLWKLGYRVISKVLNSGDPACCEFVVARLGSVNNVSDTWRNVVRSSHDVCPARRVLKGPFTKTRSSG